METEQYPQQEAVASIQTAQEAPLKVESGEQQTAEKNRFYYRFGELMADATDELERALAMFQKERAALNRREMDINDVMGLGIAIYRIRLELLMRRNPEARELHDALKANGLKVIEAQKQWEKDILATEGPEGLKRRKQLGEGPINQNTPEELDMNVRMTQLQVEAGILNTSDLKHAMEVRDAGGYYQWEKGFRQKNEEEDVRQFASMNHPETAQILENTRRFNEELYGKDYAEQRHAILAELANIAAQKAATTPAESTTS